MPVGKKAAKKVLKYFGGKDTPKNLRPKVTRKTAKGSERYTKETYKAESAPRPKGPKAAQPKKETAADRKANTATARRKETRSLKKKANRENPKKRKYEMDVLRKERGVSKIDLTKPSSSKSPAPKRGGKPKPQQGPATPVGKRLDAAADAKKLLDSATEKGVRVDAVQKYIGKHGAAAARKHLGERRVQAATTSYNKSQPKKATEAKKAREASRASEKRKAERKATKSAQRRGEITSRKALKDREKKVLTGAKANTKGKLKVKKLPPGPRNKPTFGKKEPLHGYVGEGTARRAMRGQETIYDQTMGLDDIMEDKELLDLIGRNVQKIPKKSMGGKLISQRGYGKARAKPKRKR